MHPGLTAPCSLAGLLTEFRPSVLYRTDRAGQKRQLHHDAPDRHGAACAPRGPCCIPGAPSRSRQEVHRLDRIRNTRQPPASSVLLSWMSPGRARAATAQTSGARSTPAAPCRPLLCDGGDDRAGVGALADRRRESPAWEELQQWTEDELRDLREHLEGTDPRRPRRRTGGCGPE